MRLPLLACCLLLGFAANTICPAGATNAARTGSADAEADALRVTHGPILGRPGAHQMGVWIRTSQPATFRVAYVPVAAADGPESRLSDAGETTIERDNTGWVLIDGLEAGTEYAYLVLLETAEDYLVGPEGTFRTLPESDDYRHPELNPEGLFNFRFEFACGNNQNAGQGSGPDLPGFATMLREGVPEEIDFAILNGDWLYEDARDYPVETWREQVGIGEDETPRLVELAPTIVGVWENYKRYLQRGENLVAWHRVVPSFFTFDDHEILNDVWGAGSPGLVDRRAVFRDIGVQAWYDYLGWSNPVEFTQGVHFGRCTLSEGSDVLVDPEADFTELDLDQAGTLHVHWGTPDAGVNDNALDDLPPANPNAGVYEIARVLDDHRLRIAPPALADSEGTYSIGRRSYYRFRVANCDFFVLDTRSHRELHDVERPDQPGLSMLGERQKQWLLEGMAESDADFFFVVSSVNFMVPHVGGGAVRATNKDDAWTVFLDEREQLIEFWDSLGRPVFVLTGDLHNSFAIRITDRVWEFASGPHNSQNHIAADEGDRPPNGTFDSRGRTCEIRWSSYFLSDVPRDSLRYPLYCVVQVNNVLRNPAGEAGGEDRWIAFPRPQVVFQYYDGLTGELRYAETIVRSE